MTTLGLSERVESVLAYLFFWVSGLVLFLFEKNREVRWHAAQSLVTFGMLSLLSLAASILRGMFHWIPLFHLLTDFGLSLLINALWWTTIILWLWLMVMAWIRPHYELPVIGQWVRRLA
ncbi:MAG: hypothetical protein IMW89_08295 [Ktedonobacteraceae bacterium]|nr:hypothetical protein [Ktedonobacteraceae bacterium]